MYIYICVYIYIRIYNELIFSSYPILTSTSSFEFSLFQWFSAFQCCGYWPHTMLCRTHPKGGSRFNSGVRRGATWIREKPFTSSHFGMRLLWNTSEYVVDSLIVICPYMSQEFCSGKQSQSKLCFTFNELRLSSRTTLAQFDLAMKGMFGKNHRGSWCAILIRAKMSISQTSLDSMASQAAHQRATMSSPGKDSLDLTRHPKNRRSRVTVYTESQKSLRTLKQVLRLWKSFQPKK